MRLIDANILIEEIKSLEVTMGGQSLIHKSGKDSIINLIEQQPTIDAEPVVYCKDCIYWQDRKIKMSNGEYRDYLPDEEMFVAIDKGINVGEHCTLHGYDNMSGSWFWAKANDFCSKGKRKNCAKMDEVQE